MKARAKMQLIKRSVRKQLPLTASKFGGVVTITGLQQK